MPLLTESHPTPFGPVDFTDGRLTFVNRKLAPGYRPVEESGFDKRNIHLGTFTQHPDKWKSIAADWSWNDTIVMIGGHMVS